jgi:PilZ domain
MIRLWTIWEKTSNWLEEIVYPIIDLSPNGLCFAYDESISKFQLGDHLHLTLDDEMEEEIEVGVNIRHLARMRLKKGKISICGVQFDLKSRSLAAQLESRFAALQRIFIRSLKERSSGQSIDFKLF